MADQIENGISNIHVVDTTDPGAMRQTQDLAHPTGFMKTSDPTAIFLGTGLVFRALMRAYWTAFAIRLAVDLALPPLQLVLIGTAMELTILVSEIPTGVVADVVSRKLSVVISFILIGAATITAGVVSAFPALIASQVVFGFGYTFQSGAETAWFTDEIGSAAKAESVILRRGRLQMVASVVGIGGGALLSTLTSLEATIIVSGALMLAWGVWLAVVMPERGFTRRRAEGMARRSFAEGVDEMRDTFRVGSRLAWNAPALRILLVVMVAVGFGSEAVDRLDLRRLDQVGLSQDTNEIWVVGVIASLQAVLGGLALWFTRNHLARSRLVPGLALLLAASAGGIVVLGSVPTLSLAAVGLVLQGGFRNAAAPVMIAWTNAHAESSHRATIHSFVGQAEATGEIGGGVVLGSVAALSTVSTSLAVSAALFGGASLYALRARRVW